MNGLNNLPNKSDQNTFIFYANASSSISGSFQAWNIPEYATFLHFTVIGGGGGGGGGCGGAAAASGRSGGAGGAPGGIVALSIPTILLPKTLYLQVGFGGTPGTGSTSQAVTGQGGQSGTISYVCFYPEINSGSILIQSSNTAPGGGGGGGSGASVVGTAITLTDTSSLKWLGIVGNTVTQTAASAGNTTTTPTSVTYAGLLTGGGAGGTKPANVAGTIGAGITMTSIGSYITTTIAGGAGSSTGVGGVGSNGFFSWKPFISTGGAGGGGTSFNALGGSGGVGAYGSGGGGGGTSTGTGGTGGDGGEGLIIITVA
jgi:hypothetical protein